MGGKTVLIMKDQIKFFLLAYDEEYNRDNELKKKNRKRGGRSM